MSKKSRIAIALGIMFSAGATLGLAGDEMQNQNPENELELHNVTLTDPLSITVAPGNTIELPAGTVIGKQEVENAGAETELANVMLVQDLTFTDPTTGQTITLPAGTTIQKLEIEPNEFKLLAVDQNGNVIQQIRNEVGEDEAEHAADAARRRDGQAVANANRERNELRNVTLTDPLTVTIDAAGDTIVFPAGTIVGKQEVKNGETELKNVTLVADLTFTDPTTGQTVTLAAGTRIQKLEVEPNEFKLHAVQPDGTVVRIRNEVGEDEAEHANRGRRGRDGQAVANANRGPGSQNSGPGSVNSGRDRAARAEVAEMENEVENEVEDEAEHAVANANRGPGGANSGPGSANSGRSALEGNRGPGSANSDRPEGVSGRGDRGGDDRGERMERAVAAAVDRPSSGDRPQRVERSERPQRVDRVERSDHSGRH